jgi:hypothetical protein
VPKKSESYVKIGEARVTIKQAGMIAQIHERDWREFEILRYNGKWRAAFHDDFRTCALCGKPFESPKEIATANFWICKKCWKKLKPLPEGYAPPSRVHGRL